MTSDKSFIDKVFSWFYDVSNDDPNASTRRGLAWFDTPNARVAATQIGYREADADEILAVAKRLLLEGSPPPKWRSTVEAEKYLRQVLENAVEDLR